jgi:anti-sigma B factor antagonist
MAEVWPLNGLLNIGVRPVRDGVRLVTVGGEVDMLTVSSLRQTLAPIASDPAVHLLVCDLSGVTFFGCSGVTALLDTRADMVERGARLRLVARAHAVLRPLTVTGLLDLLPVSEDVRSALS